MILNFAFFFLLIIAINGSTLASPESLRPSMTKPNSDGIIDTKKPAPVSAYFNELFEKNCLFF